MRPPPTVPGPPPLHGVGVVAPFDLALDRELWRWVPEDVSARLHDFLAEAGVVTVSGAHLGLDARIWRVPYETTARLVREADSPRAEAVFVSCTNLPTYDLVAPLEQELGKPLLTANQVTLWAALRMADAAAV